MKFSNREKKDLLIAGFMISVAFAILLAGGYRAFLGFNSGFLIVFMIAFLTAGIGFLLHELMHKYVAQSYGLFAEFRAFYGYLWLAIAFSLLGFIIAAPGAVFIRGYGLNRERNGKISWAGPMTNLVLAVMFLVLILLFPMGGVLGALLNFGLTINALLAAFNMIPVMPFDGAKILAWNRGIYGITTVAAIGLFILSFFV